MNDIDMNRLEGSAFEILAEIDPAPMRSGIAETPARYARMLRDLTAGYAEDPAEILKTFEDGAEQVNQMVCVGPIPFYSLCEHHLAPFFGTAHVAYLPQGRVVGLSKLARLVDCFARRLQVQERMTQQIADALAEGVMKRRSHTTDPESTGGVGILLQARHLCMEMRGIRKPGAQTTTSALLGAFRDDATVRAEFLDLARGGGR